MRHYALIGFPLSHSFSKKFFETKFTNQGITESTYSLIELEKINNLREIAAREKLMGFNVTVPHKVSVMSYLDFIDPEARSVGAVNCVHIVDGTWKGYNTDTFGFSQLLNQSCKNRLINKALLLGDGGAARAVQYVLERKKINYQMATRKGLLTYANLKEEEIHQTDLIVQCTTLGMFPNIHSAPDIPYDAIHEKQVVIDLIYNPETTEFMKRCNARGAQVVNGLLMLQQQAEKSWEIWNGD